MFTPFLMTFQKTIYFGAVVCKPDDFNCLRVETQVEPRLKRIPWMSFCHKDLWQKKKKNTQPCCNLDLLFRYKSLILAWIKTKVEPFVKSDINISTLYQPKPPSQWYNHMVYPSPSPQVMHVSASLCPGAVQVHFTRNGALVRCHVTSMVFFLRKITCKRSKYPPVFYDFQSVFRNSA